jgi:hypothetical protein
VRIKYRLFSPILILTALSLICCTPSQTPNLQITRLPLPTKDEVALINGHPLSVGDYLVLRSQLDTSTPEETLWVGIAAIVLQDTLQSHGKVLSSPAAVGIARYALRAITEEEAKPHLIEYYNQLKKFPSPEDVKREVEEISSKSLIQRNSRALSELK